MESVRLAMAITVLTTLAVASGLDCDAAAKANAEVCELFGAESEPCQTNKIHRTARCFAGHGDLGESQAPEPVAPKKVTTMREIHETVKLANEVYEHAEKNCKCPDKAPEPKAGNIFDPDDRAKLVRDKMNAILEGQRMAHADAQAAAEKARRVTVCNNCEDAFHASKGCEYQNRENMPSEHMPEMCKNCNVELSCPAVTKGDPGTYALPPCATSDGPNPEGADPAKPAPVDAPAQPPCDPNCGQPNAMPCPAGVVACPVTAQPTAAPVPGGKGGKGGQQVGEPGVMDASSHVAGIYLGEADPQGQDGDGDPAGDGKPAPIDGIPGMTCEDFTKDKFMADMKMELSTMDTPEKAGTDMEAKVKLTNEERCGRCNNVFYTAEGCPELLQGTDVEKMWPPECTGCGSEKLTESCKKRKKDAENAKTEADNAKTTANTPVPAKKPAAKPAADPAAPPEAAPFQGAPPAVNTLPPDVAAQFGQQIKKEEKKGVPAGPPKGDEAVDPKDGKTKPIEEVKSVMGGSINDINKGLDYNMKNGAANDNSEDPVTLN